MAEQSADEDRDHDTNTTAGHSNNQTADYSTVQSAVQPGVLLDICLARASTLHVKLDKMSAKVSGRRKSTDGDRANQSDDQLEEYSTDSAQLTGDSMTRLAQHSGNVSNSKGNYKLLNE